MCPTYKNITSSTKLVGGKALNSQETISMFNYLNEKQVDVLKISDKPYFNPVVLSLHLNSTNDEIVEIPDKDNVGKFIEKYAIHFYLESGEVEIFYNSKDNKPSLLLYPGAKWNVRNFERNINKIFVYNRGMEDKYSLYLIVEKL